MEKTTGPCRLITLGLHDCHQLFFGRLPRLSQPVLLSPQGFGNPHALDNAPAFEELMLQPPLLMRPFPKAEKLPSAQVGPEMWGVSLHVAGLSCGVTQISVHTVTTGRCPAAAPGLRQALPSSASDSSLNCRETGCTWRPSEPEVQIPALPVLRTKAKDKHVWTGSARRKECSFNQQDRSSLELAGCPGKRAASHGQWLGPTGPSEMSTARGQYAQRAAPEGPSRPERSGTRQALCEQGSILPLP